MDVLWFFISSHHRGWCRDAQLRSIA
jgi:hypothetical protein